jgi:putative NADH-flavin reductase
VVKVPHVLIIGASKGIGLETLKTALAAGHRVRAFSRSADRIEVVDPNLEKRCGDALNEADIAEALDGIDVVVQTLGVSASDLFRPVNLFSDATRVLVFNMQRCGVKRLIAVTGFGAGESRNAISCLQIIPFRLFLGRAYDDKDLQERIIKNSHLDWTIVRPGILNNGPTSDRYKILIKPSQWRNGAISRSDVADFIVRSIDGNEYIHQAPVLVS